MNWALTAAVASTALCFAVLGACGEPSVSTGHRMAAPAPTRVATPPSAAPSTSAPAPEDPAKAPPAATATPKGDVTYADRLVTKMETFVDAICACSDMTCVKREQKRAADFMVRAASELGEKVPPTPQQRQRTNRATSKLTACLQKIQSGSP